jgi:hypothetical protein
MNGETYFKMKQLTIGELIATVTDAALEVTEDEDKAYQISGLLLMRLLAAPAPETADYLFAACGSTTIH